MFIGLFVGLATCFVVAADDDLAKKELAKLQGKWVMEALEVDGKPVPQDKIENTTLVIEGDRYELTTRGRKHEMILKLDPAQKPKHLDMTGVEGANKDKVLKGIYEVEGNKLKICRGLLPEQDRPRELGTWPDTNYFLVIWKKKE